MGEARKKRNDSSKCLNHFEALPFREGQFT